MPRWTSNSHFVIVISIITNTKIYDDCSGYSEINGTKKPESA